MSRLSRKLREREFVELTRELLDSEPVRMMGRWKHHGPVTTLDHSLFVAFSTYRVARLLRMDVHAAVRGALLHDLYLYDSRDKSAHPGNQCFDHPRFAARNAAALTPSPTRSRTSSSPTCGPWAARCPGRWRPGWWTWWTRSAPGWRCPGSAGPLGCGSGLECARWRPPADKRQMTAFHRLWRAVFVGFGMIPMKKRQFKLFENNSLMVEKKRKLCYNARWETL